MEKGFSLLSRDILSPDGLRGYDGKTLLEKALGLFEETLYLTSISDDSITIIKPM